MKIGLITAFLSVLLFASCSTVTYRSASGISKDQAILIARHETAKLGWMHVDNEIKITAWTQKQACRANNKSPKHKKDDLIKRFKNLRFWKIALDYKPGAASNSADAVVYVNRRDGSILSINFGEIKGR